MKSPTLRCLGDRDAPERLVDDMRRLCELPPSAKGELWSVLGPTLGEPIPASAEGLLDAFAVRHALSGTELALALKSARYLLRRAAELDLTAADFALDLATLGAASGADLESLLLRGYEVAKGLIRSEIVSRVIARHGAVLVDVDWRVDVIARAPEAASLRAPIAMLTLRYLEEGRLRAVTLQATPETVGKLAAVCTELLK